jgi:hypothetical protein
MYIHNDIDIIQEIYWLSEFPDALDDLDDGDLYSLKARLQTMPDPTLRPLYNIVCEMTSSAHT